MKSDLCIIIKSGRARVMGRHRLELPKYYINDVYITSHARAVRPPSGRDGSGCDFVIVIDNVKRGDSGK